jgi:hypothetical protein
LAISLQKVPSTFGRGIGLGRETQSFNSGESLAFLKASLQTSSTFEDVKLEAY